MGRWHLLYVVLTTMIVHRYEASHGSEHSNDDFTPSSQMELEDYQKKQKLEGVIELKQELNKFPDITGQTQREGTLRENYIRPEISKSEYWSKTCEYTFDVDLCECFLNDVVFLMVIVLSTFWIRL